LARFGIVNELGSEFEMKITLYWNNGVLIDING